MAAFARIPAVLRPAALGLALAVASGVALATVFWTTEVFDADAVARWQASMTAGRGGPALALAVGVALLVGASMVAMPCGFPAVFAVPTILEGERHTAGRLRALSAFALGGVVPLALAGAAAGARRRGVVESPWRRSFATAVRRHHVLVAGRRRARVRARRVRAAAHTGGV